MLAGWREHASFRAAWSAELASVAFAAYCWECPAVTLESLGSPFECVFVESAALPGERPDPSVFAAHFRPGERAATFGNLGGDALLVAPCPEPPPADFAHLARFQATASTGAKDAFWQAVGTALGARLGARFTWLSTAGLGVPWLHVRLDEQPKYFRHAPYRRA